MSYPFTCTECGKSGTEDDLCVEGGECPDKDCDGTIIATSTPSHRFYFTFGRAYNLRDNFVVIEAVDRTAARNAMQGVYGRNYAFDYDETSFAGQPAKYGLTQVPFGTPVIQEHPL